MKTDSNKYSNAHDGSAIVAVHGTVTRITAKAIEFYTEADGINRYFPLSQISADLNPRVGGRYCLYIRLWKLKKRDGTYPVWATSQLGLVP